MTYGARLPHSASSLMRSSRPDHRIANRTWQVRLMGELAVSQHHRRWDGAEVGSRRARRLLALLTIDAGHLVTMDRIVETLWPTGAPQSPAANVATLVSRLRATFHSHVIVGGRQGYRLGEQVGNDLSTAAELVAAAEAHLATQEFKPAQVAAKGALDLMRHEALPELADDPWVMPARARRLQLRRRAWHAHADAALRAGDPEAALVTAEAATTAEPLDEAACRAEMRACDALDQPARALLAYNRLRDVLARDLGIDPAQSTQALYLTILRRREDVPSAATR
jgi:DNA-binding SARP family transcriptional activator